MKAPQFRQYQKGLSLIEIMVAMTISLILMAAVLTILSSSKRTYALQDELGKLQENARFVFSELKKDLRMAGYYGCSGKVDSQIINAFDGSLNNQPVRAAEVKDGDVVLTNNQLTRTEAKIRNSDILVINSLPRIIAIDAPMNTAANAPNNLGQQESTITGWFTTTRNFFFYRNQETSTVPAAGETIFVGDCSNTLPYVVDSVQPTTTVDGEGRIDIQGQFNRNFSWPIQVMQAHSGTADFASTYEVGGIDKTGNGTPSDVADGFGLFRNRGDASLLFIEGVQNMQILYGIDGNNNQVADTYSRQWTAGDVVVSIQVALLMRTTNRRLDFAAIDKNFDLLELPTFNPSADPGEEGFKHRVFTTTIKVRN